jgi:hypothetical protein
MEEKKLRADEARFLMRASTAKLLKVEKNGDLSEG